MKQRVLVVEDSPVVLKILRHVLKSHSVIEPVYAGSLAEVAEVLDQSNTFFAALVDLNLPDAPDGGVVDYVLEQGIPTVVLTGSFDEERRKSLLDKGVVDYITKEGRYSYEYAGKLLGRLVRNQGISVLVVDDSKVGRRSLVNLLHLHQYQVHEAEDGVQGIKLLLEHPEIKLIITDYNMPRMDGCSMVQTIRGKYEKSDLGIIGLSSEGDETLSARFIKSGADDFLQKPFNQEEFFCRVTHNIETLEMIEAIRDIANRDALTGAYSRPYFFQRGEFLVSNALEKGIPVSVAVIELEGFREINAHYGHQAADEVMAGVAKRLMAFFDRFLFARSDGASFYILMSGLDNDKAVALVERVRQLVGPNDAVWQGEHLAMSFSGGVSSCPGKGVDDLVKNAERCLQRAKDAGGDLVIGDD